MSISTTSCRNDYVGNGSTATYAYGFLVFSASDLLVTVQDLSGNVSNPPFTAIGVRVRSGGTITLTGGNLALGYALTVRSKRPLTQTSDIRNQGSGYRDLVEDTFDMLVMNDQQQQEQIDLALKMPETVTAAFNPTLPAAFAAPNMVPVSNSSGTGMTAIPVASLIGPQGPAGATGATGATGAPGPAGSGGIVLVPISATTALAVGSPINQQYVPADATAGALNANLPTANLAAIGQAFTVKKIDASANAVSVVASGTDKILTTALLGSVLLANQGDSYTILCRAVGNWDAI